MPSSSRQPDVIPFTIPPGVFWYTAEYSTPLRPRPCSMHESNGFRPPTHARQSAASTDRRALSSAPHSGSSDTRVAATATEPRSAFSPCHQYPVSLSCGKKNALRGASACSSCTS